MQSNHEEYPRKALFPPSLNWPIVRFHTDGVSFRQKTNDRPLPPVEPGEPADEGNTNAKQPGGVLLDKPSPDRKACPNSDGIGKLAIAEFNATHSWDYVFGQTARYGRYRVRADDETPSIVPNKDGKTAKDFGRNGEYHDKFDWWLIVNKLDKTAELKRLIADYRNRVDAQPSPAPASTELVKWPGQCPYHRKAHMRTRQVKDARFKDPVSVVFCRECERAQGKQIVS